ncbi:FXYD domain-containing ion transport regulator 11 [Scomber scombrus]|uniref:FXYD domain-containing ion transport regulator n=1 Tax=Scomber scombrus TaxID=13677 RepID=A0AAV1N4G2_SCOSC
MRHLTLVTVIAVLFTLFVETEANPFVYNYERLRIGGLICACLLVAGGISVILYNKCSRSDNHQLFSSSTNRPRVRTIDCTHRLKVQHFKLNPLFQNQANLLRVAAVKGVGCLGESSSFLSLLKYNVREVNSLKLEDVKDLCFGVDDTLPQTACWRPDSSRCPLSHWHHHPVQWPLQVQVQPGQEKEDRKQCSADAQRPRSFLRLLDVTPTTMTSRTCNRQITGAEEGGRTDTICDIQRGAFVLF